MATARWWIGPMHVGAFLVAMLAWIVVIAVVGVGLTLVTDPTGNALAALTDPKGPAFTGFVGILTLLQFAGMLGIAVVGASVVPGPRPGRLRANLALRTPRAPEVAVAVVLGFSGGIFPSWFVEQLQSVFPNLVPIVDSLISQALHGPPLARVMMALAVAVAAPLTEELTFRGYLWSAIEASAPKWVAFVATTLLFSAIHVDPAQVIGVLPLALVLGWARYTTGSIWPGITIHAVNNSLALVLAASPAFVETKTPTAVAFAALAITLAGCAGLWAVRRPAAVS